jgi:plastocyanin
MRARSVSRRLLAGLVVLIFSAGCGSVASPTPTSTRAPNPTVATAAATTTPTPSATSPTGSGVAAVRCAETDNATPSATVQWDEVMGPEATIKAGQAVVFVTTGFSPTVTEWINGTPAASPCIDKAIGSDTNNGMSLVVTFYQPGDYNITCRVIPLEMHTIVHVR